MFPGEGTPLTCPFGVLPNGMPQDCRRKDAGRSHAGRAFPNPLIRDAAQLYVKEQLAPNLIGTAAHEHARVVRPYHVDTSSTLKILTKEGENR